ncbi:unnamed protein product [Heligmosomoides polygyrus]|uniref:Uncharacterized protein n=1 Tax=Heligmosomoides polygyrus TaxID=6339 RepID=A0A3P8AD08_HELPZ|nr:unnamed protein product [Heligmosomoides polygyrus]
MPYLNFREVKNSLNLFTLATCIFVSLEGLIFHSRFFTVKQAIPTRVYLKIVVIFFIVNLCNNYAMKCNIYFPLFIIFKSVSDSETMSEVYKTVG